MYTCGEADLQMLLDEVYDLMFFPCSFYRISVKRYNKIKLW